MIMKKFLEKRPPWLALGVMVGVGVTRIVDGNNVFGAIAAGVVIGLITWVLATMLMKK
jgi:membrane-associated phospholipid phosphatase